MIDYNAFHNYLVELVKLYRRTKSTKGMSGLAQKWHCTAVTRDQFYQMKLDKLSPEQVTMQLSRVVRDTIGKSDAKATLRETIGALNEGLLATSRISQGADSTVQITITQPTTATPKVNKTLFRQGQVVFFKGISMNVIALIDKLYPDMLGYRYELVVDSDGKEQIIEFQEPQTLSLLQPNLRIAKGNEIARFLGALTRKGYEWSADNANGLFFIKKKESKAVEVFANDLPDGYKGVFALPSFEPSPYRYAVRVECVDNADAFMGKISRASVFLNAVLRQIEVVESTLGIAEYLEYDVPTLCGMGYLREHRIAFLKTKNGSCYWLAKDRDVLRMLAWISYIV